MNYWHFMADQNGHPVMRDGVVPVVGRRYEIEGEPVLCKHGYHGAARAIDALHYAPGPWVSLRSLIGVINGDDKSVGRAFVQTQYVDATDTLREFARWCALQVIGVWDAPAVVRRYLETGDESIRAAAQDAAWAAAQDAAQDAARDAARDAAWAVAEDAAWAAAWNAAWAAARDAAWAVAWAAARDAAWAAARDAQNEKLEEMLLGLLEAER